MVFSSYVFLFYFLPVFFLVYFAMVKARCSTSWLNLWITVASYFFYGWVEPWFVLLMFGASWVDYFAGVVISKPKATRKTRNWALGVSMVTNLSLLGFFKYYMFFMGAVNDVMQALGNGPGSFFIANVVLPAGISFYTFHSMSYTIDVWRGDAPPVRDFRSFSCYVALFPQLVAGPIGRYNVVSEMLYFRTHTLKNFAEGGLLFCVGLAKKVLLANGCGAVADKVWAADAPGLLSAWWGSLAYMLQIYFDFAAYSEMAFGLALMLGIEIVRNFNAPYRAHSITDFWTKWHMSLTHWLRDYLYFSLGGNRVKTKFRLYFNLFLVMFISGLWHGAQWTFVCWGLFHAFFMILERAYGKKSVYASLPFWIQILITQVIVLFGWVLFRAPTLESAMDMWARLLALKPGGSADALLHAQIFAPWSMFFMILGIVLCLQPWQSFEWCRKATAPRLAIGLALFVLSCLVLFTQAYNPFLYFQF